MNIEEDDIVFQLFKKYAEEKGFSITEIDEEGVLKVENDEMDFSISLDNLRKDYARDPSEELVQVFVNAILDDSDLPSWDEAGKDVFPSLFPGDFEFGEYVNYPVTDAISMIVVHESETKKRWISESQLDTWGIDNELLLQTAYRNLDRVLETAILEEKIYEGDRKLYSFSIEDDTMLAALLMAKGLKSKVEPVIGWPVTAVVPTRDNILLYNSEDFEFFAEEMGGMVLAEYQESAYPLTTEILECSDQGVNAIAKYEANEEE